ncbi:hypothetical protein E2320_001035 [Naja naja]|nr:hypothetical protein E2320_001035 [Naja naja]
MQTRKFFCTYTAEFTEWHKLDNIPHSLLARVRPKHALSASRNSMAAKSAFPTPMMMMDMGSLEACTTACRVSSMSLMTPSDLAQDWRGDAYSHTEHFKHFLNYHCRRVIGTLCNFNPIKHSSVLRETCRILCSSLQRTSRGAEGEGGCTSAGAQMKCELN